MKTLKIRNINLKHRKNPCSSGFGVCCRQNGIQMCEGQSVKGLAFKIYHFLEVYSENSSQHRRL